MCLPAFKSLGNLLLNFTGKSKDGSKKKNKNIVRPGTKPKKDIKSMFAAAAASSKKKPEVGSLFSFLLFPVQN